MNFITLLKTPEEILPVFFKPYFLTKTKIKMKTEIKTNIKNKNHIILFLNFKKYGKK
jgi:hypothetical protein